MIKWVPFVQNHAFGIKKYIFHEEAYMPSLGFHDARNRMISPINLRLFKPWTSGVYFKKVDSLEII
jgi:hypothetical protein